jgi:hypothetical protein
MALREISKLIRLKPEPQTTPSLSLYIEKDRAKECVSDYKVTPSLRAHFKRVFETVVHRNGQGYWVQAEYGAGKTHFLATLVDLLMWRELELWNSFDDEELKKEYVAALSKVKMFPVAFSLRGMGESNDKDMHEQFREGEGPQCQHADDFTNAEYHHGQACQLQQAEPVEELQTVADPSQHIRQSPSQASIRHCFALPVDDTCSIISLATIASRKLFRSSPFFSNLFESSQTDYCPAELKSVWPNLTFGICLV